MIVQRRAGPIANADMRTGHLFQHEAEIFRPHAGGGVAATRVSPVSGTPRGPFCMMGACFECVVSVDGHTERACMTEVRDGMCVEMT